MFEPTVFGNKKFLIKVVVVGDDDCSDVYKYYHLMWYNQNKNGSSENIFCYFCTDNIVDYNDDQGNSDADAANNSNCQMNMTFQARILIITMIVIMIILPPRKIEIE